MKRNALGRGLDSLISIDSMDDIQLSGSSAINDIPISEIEPNQEHHLTKHHSMNSLRQSKR